MRFDLADIQGNLLRGYRLPFARYLHMNFGEAGPAHAFLDRLLPLITSAETWDEGKPAQTVNISLSRTALEALELPARPSIRSPSSFSKAWPSEDEFSATSGLLIPRNGIRSGEV